MKTSLLILSILTAVLLSGCSRAGSYRFLGTDVLSVSASDAVIAEAMRDAAFSLAAHIVKPDGSKQFPSFHEKERRWSAAKETKNSDLRRSLVEFDDAQGIHNTIETVREKGRPTFVFLSPAPAADGAVPPLLNAFVKALEKQHVTVSH